MAELMVLGRCVYVGVIAVLIALFFSSRRRHTIWTGDWSSDVCSSDLDVDIVRPAPGSDGDDPGRNTSVNDRAAIRHLDEMLASSENIIKAVSGVLANGEIPIILGGDHAIAVPTFSAIASHYKQQGSEV